MADSLYKGASLVSLRQMLQLASVEEGFLEALAAPDCDQNALRRAPSTARTSGWEPLGSRGPTNRFSGS